MVNRNGTVRIVDINNNQWPFLRHRNLMRRQRCPGDVTVPAVLLRGPRARGSSHCTLLLQSHQWSHGISTCHQAHHQAHQSRHTTATPEAIPATTGPFRPRHSSPCSTTKSSGGSSVLVPLSSRPLHCNAEIPPRLVMLEATGAMRGTMLTWALMLLSCTNGCGVQCSRTRTRTPGSHCLMNLTKESPLVMHQSPLQRLSQLCTCHPSTITSTTVLWAPPMVTRLSPVRTLKLFRINQLTMHRHPHHCQGCCLASQQHCAPLGEQLPQDRNRYFIDHDCQWFTE